MSKADVPINAELLSRQLIEHLQSYPDAVIAFSGGVDSAVVAAACYRALGNRAVAITGVGPAVADSELEDARAIASQIGMVHIELPTREIEDPDYVRNDPRRCFHCKKNLYGTLRDWARRSGFSTLVSGTNQDDLGDYRPGLQAASQHDVRAPLVELGIGKEQVRELASFWKLSIASKPASPCLASRIAYGESVTVERLSRIEQGERFLRSLGFDDVRARVHADDLLRLEIHRRQWDRILEPETNRVISEFMESIGFRFVTLDLMSRQSGSLNRVLPVLGDVDSTK
ncbi:ATP-dependent sacrificial sulfur transferase LarE [Pirellulaceae bacterium SH501]